MALSLYRDGSLLYRPPSAPRHSGGSDPCKRGNGGTVRCKSCPPITASYYPANALPVDGRTIAGRRVEGICCPAGDVLRYSERLWLLSAESDLCRCGRKSPLNPDAESASGFLEDKTEFPGKPAHNQVPSSYHYSSPGFEKECFSGGLDGIQYAGIQMDIHCGQYRFAQTQRSFLGSARSDEAGNVINLIFS